MKFVDEFRSPALARKVTTAIAAAAGDRAVAFMEVCGTHTMAIARFGLRRLLPENLRLISGPGCPVCVTPQGYIDQALAAAALPDVTITTFGDMMRVPGAAGDLAHARAAGADIRVVYSPNDALATAAALPDRKVVFLAVGFETTAPAVAATVAAAAQKRVNNYFVLVAHKMVPPALDALCRDADLPLDGFLLPAHVSAILGTRAYEPLAQRYGVACAVAGFEPVDILYGVLLLLRQLGEGARRVDNEYSRVVKAGGNPRARAVLEGVFERCDATWRGLGEIPESGLRLRWEYAHFDAAWALQLPAVPETPPVGCRCGDVLTGKLTATGCPLFGGRCTPETPVGPCMVSSEGTCAAAFKYEL